MNVSFPLRDGYFRPLQYTPEDEARWRQLMIDLVALGVSEEREYAASHYERVDSAQWKLLREKDQLRVYRPRSAAIAAGRSAQCVLAVGTIEGTLEDVIHGVHHVTTQDMRVTTSFLSADALDSAVLHIFENGTDEDPFRSFAVKWRIIETPAGGLVKNRDGVVLEYLGIDRDARGERYAFHITETFDHPVCPPFSPQCAIRAKAHIRIIYRQVSAGRVGVYFLGDYALSGRIPGVIARMSTAEIAVSVGKSVECTEAKKLTALALTSSPVLNRTMRVTPRSTHQCSICQSVPGLLATRSMALCHLCGSSVCAKCRSRKHLLSDEKKIPVSCCKKCIVAAKNLTLDPSLPLRLVSASRWRSQNTIQGDTLLWERECRAVEVRSMASSRSRGGSCSDGSWPGSTRSRKASGLATARSGLSLEHSIGSDLTGTSTLASSRSMSSIDLSYLEDNALQRTHSGSHAKPVVMAPSAVAPANDQAALWRQMNELRIAAEQTYQLTKYTNKLLADSEPVRR